MTETAAAPPTPQAPSFPQARTCPHQPPPSYDGLRQRGPLQQVSLYDGRTVWLVTGYDLSRRLLTDARLSSDRTRDDFPAVSPRFALVRRLSSRTSIISLDPPEHSKYRRMLISDFAVRRIRAMRGDIERIVNRFIDELLAAGSPADLVTHFARPVPSMAICLLLGVPYEDHELFQDASRRLLESQTAEGTLAARQDLIDYLEGLVAAQERQPGPGLLGRLISEQLATGVLDRSDLVSTAMLLLVAGHETTAAMIALGVIALLENPEQLAALRAAPQAVMPSAVEELLRYLSIADLAGVRVATADIEVEGQTVRAGDGVIVANSMSNRDGEVFADPDAFDVRRSARHHLAFGYGVHQCLGQNLARLELEVALSTLFERIPTLRLAVPVEELPVRPATTIQGVNELPVAW